MNPQRFHVIYVERMVNNANPYSGLGQIEYVMIDPETTLIINEEILSW